MGRATVLRGHKLQSGLREAKACIRQNEIKQTTEKLPSTEVWRKCLMPKPCFLLANMPAYKKGWTSSISLPRTFLCCLVFSPRCPCFIFILFPFYSALFLCLLSHFQVLTTGASTQWSSGHTVLKRERDDHEGQHEPWKSSRQPAPLSMYFGNPLIQSSLWAFRPHLYIFSCMFYLSPLCRPPDSCSLSRWQAGTQETVAFAAWAATEKPTLDELSI